MPDVLSFLYMELGIHAANYLYYGSSNIAVGSTSRACMDVSYYSHTPRGYGSLLCAYSHIFPPLPFAIPRANHGSASLCCLTLRLLSRVTGAGQPFLYHHRFISLPDNAYLGIQALMVTPQPVLGRKLPSNCNGQKQLILLKRSDETGCIGFGVSLSAREPGPGPQLFSAVRTLCGYR
jgi:hypothetical protein